MGCYVRSDAEDGVDVGTLGRDADCVVNAPLVADIEDVTALLRSGKNVA